MPLAAQVRPPAHPLFAQGGTVGGARNGSRRAREDTRWTNRRGLLSPPPPFKRAGQRHSFAPQCAGVGGGKAWSGRGGRTAESRLVRGGARSSSEGRETGHPRSQRRARSKVFAAPARRRVCQTRHLSLLKLGQGATLAGVPAGWGATFDAQWPSPSDHSCSGWGAGAQRGLERLPWLGGC